MKALILKAFFILTLVGSYSMKPVTEILEPKKVTATYEGYTELGYSFIFVNEDDDDEIVTFESISEKLLEQYDLTDDSYIDEKFEITFDYEVVNKEEEIKVPVLKTIKKIN
ncbi:hypothetical protein ACQY1Q_00895 [Tenacibaculum sp. TC6]|uniref:hypothetical protein n=1 Tax=Tenacibaculum sp. TC6 TaxID=3423223 RepID=UPI003D36EC56